MAARARSKVEASREAAGHLHSLAVLADESSFEGVPAAGVGAALRHLAARGVGAALGGALEAHAREVLSSLPADAPLAAVGGGQRDCGQEETGTGAEVGVAVPPAAITVTAS